MSIMFIVAVVGFAAMFPRAANILGNMIALLFILPFLTIAMGSVVWAVLGLFTHSDMSWGACLMVFGLPFGLIMAVPCLSVFNE